LFYDKSPILALLPVSAQAEGSGKKPETKQGAGESEDIKRFSRQTTEPDLMDCSRCLLFATRPLGQARELTIHVTDKAETKFN
jgi:hypothetical protein